MRQRSRRNVAMCRCYMCSQSTCEMLNTCNNNNNNTGHHTLVVISIIHDSIKSPA